MFLFSCKQDVSYKTNMYVYRLKIATLLLACVTFQQQVQAHSWMTKPKAYNRRVRTFTCNGTDCTNACPTHQYWDSPVTLEKPAEYWKRGDTIRLKWTRNNHHGGFVAFSLVPAARMYDGATHVRLTLFHACWQQGEHHCAKGEDAGTDLKERAFAMWFTLPHVFPDGLYVLRYHWYGGLHFTQRVGRFPDFTSCSIVRVGGAHHPYGSFRTFFAAGNASNAQAGKCTTSSTGMGQCGTTGCTGNHTITAVPDLFYHGGVAPITPHVVRALFTAVPRKLPAVPRKLMPRKPTLCAGVICCAERCGSCGGHDCHKRPGGVHQCCSNSIIESGRLCDEVEAPCVRS